MPVFFDAFAPTKPLHHSRIAVSSMKYDILLTRLAMGVSAVALALGLADLSFSIGAGPDGVSIKKMILATVFCLALLSLFYGNIVYQLTRIGQIKRQMSCSDDEADLEDLHWADRRRLSPFSFPPTRS